MKLYFEGDLDAAFAFGGQVAGRILNRAGGDIIDRTVAEFRDVMTEMAKRWLDLALEQNP